MAMRAGAKRARPEDAAAKREDDGAAGDDVAMADEDEDNQGADEAERARVKRAMRVRADLRFLEKLPPLRGYQRGRFGRRGGVDGGAPQDAAAPWMRALERSLEETSFVTCEAPSRAALVAPLAAASRGLGVAHMAPRATPATPAPTPVHRALPPHHGQLRAGTATALDVRGAFAGFVPVAPRTSARVVVMAGGKDDEARSAD